MTPDFGPTVPYGTFAPNLLQRGLMRMGRMIAGGRYERKMARPLRSALKRVSPTPLDVTVLGGQRMRLHVQGNSCEKRMLIIPHLFDRYELRMLSRVLHPGCTVIDIGANVGIYSIFAALRAGPDAKVIAVEPHPVALERLRCNLALNDLSDVVAVEPLKGLALSAALDLVSISVRWEHHIPFELETYPLSRETTVTSFHQLQGRGVGFTAGVLWKVFSGLQVGARYQTSVAIDLAGQNTFSFPQSAYYYTVPDPFGSFRNVLQLLDMFYVPQAVTGRMTLPREIAFGVVLTPVPNLSLCLDVQWDKWSEFGQWMFRSVNEGGDLSPDFTSEYREFYGIVPDYGTQGSDLAVKDSRKLKAGLEYRAGKWLFLRAGFARYESSVEAAGRTPIYPDPDLNIYSFGGGYEGPLFSIWDADKTISQISFDLFVRYASADAAASALPGLEMTYSAKRWIAGVGVGFMF
ncbi:MAG: FkbM family methyltransferase [Candidatus Aminicenantes bacterium]|nr:FkbM family methyltransferase [Candidatus Aminicenantes bacterium]